MTPRGLINKPVQTRILHFTVSQPELRPVEDHGVNSPQTLRRHPACFSYSSMRSHTAANAPSANCRSAVHPGGETSRSLKAVASVHSCLHIIRSLMRGKPDSNAITAVNKPVANTQRSPFSPEWPEDKLCCCLRAGLPSAAIIKT